MRVYVLLIFCVLMAHCFAQDKIVTNGGMRIRCHIVNEDSMALYYTLPQQSSIHSIPKTDVYKYHKLLSADRPSSSVFSSLPDKTLNHELLLLKLAGGFASPLGEFADMDASKSTSGLAKTGYFFQAMVILKLHKNIGVCAAYHNQSHGVDNSVVNAVFVNRFSGVNFNTTTTNWKIRGFYGGIYLTTPVASVDGLLVFADIMAGLPTYISPEFVITGSSGGNFNTVSQNASSTTALAWLGEVGLIYKLYRRFGISFCLNYFRGSANFSNVMASNSAGGSASASFSQKFESLNVQFGILLTLE